MLFIELFTYTHIRAHEVCFGWIFDSVLFRTISGNLVTDVAHKWNFRILIALILKRIARFCILFFEVFCKMPATYFKRARSEIIVYSTFFYSIWSWLNKKCYSFYRSRVNEIPLFNYRNGLNHCVNKQYIISWKCHNNNVYLYIDIERYICQDHCLEKKSCVLAASAMMPNQNG